MFACLLVAGLFLAACSSGAAPDAQAPQTPASAASSATTFPKRVALAASAQAFDDAPTPELAEMAAAAGVPPPVMAALARTHITPSQVSLLVAPADGGTPLVNLHTGIRRR